MKGRFLITSALPYINGIKHLGNLAGSMLPADVHARFRRLQGHEVLFLCATDEHGTPAELAASEAGLPVERYCEDQHNLQKLCYERFRLSFDHFGRSSSVQNRRLTQMFADSLEDAGLIEERRSGQVYSVVDKRFLPDRYVEGICPHCGYDGARGDQCENCGSLLDPVELLEPRSKISGSRNIEIRGTNHLFLLQSKMEDTIRQWIDSCSHWPSLARSIAYKWLDEGLEDRSITRDLSWGVPVTRKGLPRPGFESKVFYVWFDAPIEYIGAAAEWAEANGDNYLRWWRNDHGAEDVTYVQFMGKDNVAFHTVSFPITILGSGEPWKLVDQLKAFNWLNWYGSKFSTSQRRGIFMDQAIDLLPADYWRWYLIANSPENSDSSFTWEHFQSGINSDLANVIGNFVNRILRFVHSHLGGVVPEIGPMENHEISLMREMTAALLKVTTAHEALEFRRAAAETRALWSIGNEYVTRAAPWSAIKSSPGRAATIARQALEICRAAAIASLPIIPDSASAILRILGVQDSTVRWPSLVEDQPMIGLETRRQLGDAALLFKKIEEQDLAILMRAHPPGTKCG